MVDNVVQEMFVEEVKGALGKPKRRLYYTMGASLIAGGNFSTFISSDIAGLKEGDTIVFMTAAFEDANMELIENCNLDLSYSRVTIGKNASIVGWVNIKNNASKTLSPKVVVYCEIA